MGNDFKQISNEAKDRLVAELHRSVATVSAAVDEAAESVLDAAESDVRLQADLAAARVEHLADEGLEPLRELSAELLKRATELDHEISRLAELATEAAETLRAHPSAPEGSPLYAVPEPLVEFEPLPEPEPEPAPSAFELPPIFPALAPDSPLDHLEAQRKAIAETPLDFPPPKRRFEGPPKEPVEIRPGVRLVIEQLRLAGETERTIATRLEAMGVDDPDAVLTQI
jgi:hypothetical protein